MSDSQDNLLLYHAKPSSFSQKVTMALSYLNLKFDEKLVNLFAGEQLEPWFLDLNPKGEVPVLKDGETIISDSANILQYLNDTYDTRRSDEKLIPNPVTPLGRNVAAFNQELCSVKMFVLTFGAMFHPQHTKEPQFSDAEREGRKGFLDTALKGLEEMIVTAAPPYKECYNYKLTKLATGKTMLMDENQFLNEIDNTQVILDRVEEQLSLATTPGKWLFGDNLSTADITLIVLLRRIHYLGLQHHFFDNTRPKCVDYYKRALTESFTKASLP